MLIKAQYEGDKIKVLHAQKVDESSKYCADLAKDRSNGWTKDRSMRRIGSFPVLTMMEYDRLHPGWLTRASDGSDLAVKQGAWKEFLKSDVAKPFMTVEKMVH